MFASENIKELYAYIDTDNPLACWEVAIGRVRSADDRDKNFGISSWMYNRLKKFAKLQDKLYNSLEQWDNIIENENLKDCLKNKYQKTRLSDKNQIQAELDLLTTQIRNEFHLEHIRKNYFPNEVSRFTGVFFFESLKDAKNAIKKWFNCESMQQEKLKNIVNVHFLANHCSKVDSNWILKKINQNDDNNDWMHHYWSGVCYFNIPYKLEDPIFELIVSGIGKIQGKSLREHAYQKAKLAGKNFDIFLETAIWGFYCDVSKDIGLSKFALLYSPKTQEVEGHFYIYMDDYKNKHILNKISNIMNKNKVKCTPINESIINFQMPDQREESFSLSLKDIKTFELFNEI
ncbi:DUF2441 domain-containing protein [Lentisphaerota bacterium WC36G]|nr:DUF2441 domain-containing protein [Lentisphaerae bacterium WC36]